MKGKLVIIDDEVLILENTSMLLEDLADEIKTFDKPQEALEYLKTHEAHCIICDLNMPVMNGMEFAEQMVNKLHLKMPLIFYTGHGNQVNMRQANSLGVFDFLNKPNFDALEAIVPYALRVGMGENIPKNEIPYTSKYQELISKNLL